MELFTKIGIAVFFAVTTIAGGAGAQNWQPERPITLIVPWAAGGGAEPVARIIADALIEAYGQTVSLDFRPGANGTIALLERAQTKGERSCDYPQS